MFPPYTPPSISVKDIYGTCNPQVPKGYRAIAFRMVTTEDKCWLSVNCSSGLALTTHGNVIPDGPRIILEPLPPPRRWELVETGEVRPLMYGEYFVRHDNTVGVWIYPYPSLTDCHIVSLREIKD
jgi:hypothetical protein